MSFVVQFPLFIEEEIQLRLSDSLGVPRPGPGSRSPSPSLTPGPAAGKAFPVLEVPQSVPGSPRFQHPGI